MKVYLATLLYLVAILFSFLYTADSLQIHQIDQRFKEGKAKRIKRELPQIQDNRGLQQELADFSQMIERQEFKMFRGDPELNSNLLLKNELGKQNQTIFIMGREMSRLLIEVAVLHKSNQYNYDKQSIQVYLKNTQTNEILIGEYVKHIRLFMVDIDSDLYELFVSHNWETIQEKNENQAKNQSLQVIKHISLNVKIVQRIPQNEKKIERKEGLEVADRVELIKKETDRVFLNSLQIWDEINSHHAEHYANHQEVYHRAYIQLVVIFGIYLLEFLMMRKTLKLRPLI